MAAARALSERLSEFARRAKAAGTELELHHVSRGLVGRWDQGEEWPSGDELEGIAVDHAAALHGRQGYELRAVYAGGDGVKQAIPFRCSGEASEGDAIAEPANEKGVIALLQRQNERLLTAVERSQRPTVEALEALTRMVRAQVEQQDALFRRELDMAQMRLEQEDQAARLRLEERKWDALTARFGPIADAVVARLVPGAAPSEDTALLKLAQSITPEQQTAIYAFLDDDEKALVGEQRWRELMRSVLHRHTEKLVAILRPEQMAILDAMAQGPAQKRAAE